MTDPKLTEAMAWEMAKVIAARHGHQPDNWMGEERLEEAQAAAQVIAAALAEKDAVIEGLVGALKFCKREAFIANNVIRLNRSGEGQGKIRVATALHRIENVEKYSSKAAAALAQAKGASHAG